MRQNKSIKIFINYVLGPLLFAWLSYAIYRQVAAEPQLQQSWQHILQALNSYKISMLAAVIFLMGINWAIEAYKWKLAVSAVHPVSFLQSFKAVLSGVSFSVALPNRIGEYAGRLLFLPDGKRMRAVANTVGGSISQLLVTLICGLAGFILLKEPMQQQGLFSGDWYLVLLAAATAITAVLTVLYFGMAHIGRWLVQKRPNSRYAYLVRSLQTFDLQLLLLLLLLSFLRYGVFIAQYFLLFTLFGVNASIIAIWSVISVVFLTLAVVPTIALVEIGLRGKISLQLMALFTANSLGVLLTTVSIWAINLIIPALIGSILILRIKVFKQKHEAIEF